MKPGPPLEIVTHAECGSEKTSDPCGIVIFGASGDLARRKLLPALYQLYHARLIPENFFIVGSARTRWNDKIFRTRIFDILSDQPHPSLREKFVQHIYYHCGEYSDPEALRSLD